MRTGLWVTPLDTFQRAVADLYYRSGGFSFVQIGANDGVSFDDLFWLVKRFNGRGLVVEPMASAFERLRHNYRPFPAVRPVRSAVHPTETSLTLHRVKADSVSDVPAWASGAASMLADWIPNQGVLPEHLETEQVPARHLMDILNEHNITSLDVLQVDVEGFDHDVIRMLDFDRLTPRIIKYEALQSHAPKHVECEREMANYLRDRGYSTVNSGMDVIARRK